jgi:integrase
MPQRGSGTITKRGKIWWVQVCVHGQRVRQSSESEKWEVADRLRNRLLGQKARGELGGPNAKVTVNTVLDAYLDVCKHGVQPDTRTIYEYVIDADLRPHLGKLRADKLTTAHLAEYRKKRAGEKTIKGTNVSPSSINRELVILRAALRSAARATPPLIQLYNIPRFTLEDERPFARSGFVVDDVFEKVLAELPPHLHPISVCAYNSAVRVGELKKIQWPAVDFEAGLIRLQKTKNGQPRSIPFMGEMGTHLVKAKAHRDEFYADCPWVFSHLGEQIRSFKGSWKAAVKRAGYPDLLFHDFRRSGIRNLKRSGVSDSVAMRISGHKTRAVFDRYDIVDEDDLLAEADKIRAFRAARDAQKEGEGLKLTATISATVPEKETKNGVL